MAGLSGQVRALDAKLGPKWPVGDLRHLKCVRLTVESGVSLGFEARAWYKRFEFKRDWTYDFPPRTWVEEHFPSGCQDLESPTDDVIGDGVEVVDDEVDGDPGQVGRDDVFSPGSSAWILSTGLMSQLRGTSDVFASTELGGGGNPLLGDLVGGLPTHDAVSYRTTVIPEHDTLHVRYLFASEEYPEFVGSQFNDVMAVLVDGVNCALVGDDPVSVNSINGMTNSHLFVNNRGDGEGGGPYPTTMDGFTVPLQCDVPVTPGEPVKIEITVADTSDAVWDSAVALLDKGIWSS